MTLSEQLLSKLDEAEASLRALNRVEGALHEDIRTKTNSLNIGATCDVDVSRF